ncbi:diaminopimelate epimerase [Lotmaria passim]|uniref:Diaminopimelate epimerase n=1 Tax=Crithidia mellificae TaxID=796356 RepID=V9LTS4_CRIME|nr:diaminopimelate epimerase [Crithidia mellificae]
MAHTLIEFTKMHSSGNDYIYVNVIKYPLANPAELSVRWSAAHTGIGSDGLVLIGASAVADFSMRMFNSDGSEARMCGNAAICVGKFLYDKKLTRSTDVTLETLSGVRELRLHVSDGAVHNVTVNMGRPYIRDLDMAVQSAAVSVIGAAISMGNPHFVIYVDDVATVGLARVGPLIEYHSLFEDRTNVEFAHVCADGTIRMRVWERGSGVTQGCGSGACATVVAAIARGRVPHHCVSVQMDGGTVHVQWEESDGSAWLTGRAVSVYEGVIAV